MEIYFQLQLKGNIRKTDTFIMLIIEFEAKLKY